MAFRDLVERTWRENHLFTVLLELTYRCNLDCFFCYNDVGLRGRSLSREQYLGFFEDLRELGVLNLILTGGEPLAHPDLLVLGRRARELGFVVRLKSNGHALRGRLAQRLRDEVDPFLIEVSLHGARAETHDRQTRVAGSFERLLQNLEELRSLGLRLKLNSTLTRWNEDETEGMFELADRLGLPLQVDPDVTPRDDGDREPLDIRASRPGIERLFRLQAERVQALAARRAESGEDVPEAPNIAIARQGDDLPAPVAAGKHCGAGSSAIAVDPYGNVYPCVQWRRPVGNLHERSIREIWLDSRGLDEIRAQNVEVKRMVAGHGKAGAYLTFCPGAAETHTGSPLGLYAGALERKELMEGIEERRKALPVVY